MPAESIPSTKTFNAMWQAEAYHTHAPFVPALGAVLLGYLEAKAGESILDIGCGDGELTQHIVAQGATVLGIDTSPDMVAAAQKKGVSAQVGDATRLGLTEQFDAVFSNAALHWMTPPDLVLKNIYQALKPNGRFVAECGGHGNMAAVCTAISAVLATYDISFEAVSPWYFPSPDSYASRLKKQGFVVKKIELIPRPTVLPTGLVGWLAFFGQPFLACLPQGAQDTFYNRIEKLLQPILCDESGNWVLDYVRLRLVAYKPDRHFFQADNT